ncbi:hypothetical protein [Schlesneria paludicola]|uniref:hypothetical protein n=1 Tax=Schlesneria paludicola TaxID=360056 RepID=UPI00029B29BF|nr:hypothetical protein [Schlesneria paludicola]
MAIGLGNGLPRQRPQTLGQSGPADASSPANANGPKMRLPQRRPQTRPTGSSNLPDGAQVLPIYGSRPTGPMGGATPIPNHIPGQEQRQLMGAQSGPPRTLLPDSELPPPGPVHPLRTPAHAAYDAARDQRMQQGDSYSSGLQNAQAAPYQRNLKTYNSMGQPAPHMTDVRSRADAAIAGGSVGPRPAPLTPSQATMVAARGQNLELPSLYKPDNAAPAPKPYALDGTSGGSGPNGERLTMGGSAQWKQQLLDGSATVTAGVRGATPKFTEGNTFISDNGTKDGIPVNVRFDPSQGNLQLVGQRTDGLVSAGNGMVRDPKTGAIIRDPGLEKADTKAAMRKQTLEDQRVLKAGANNPVFRGSPRYIAAQGRAKAMAELIAGPARQQKMKEEIAMQAHRHAMEQREAINQAKIAERNRQMAPGLFSGGETAIRRIENELGGPSGVDATQYDPTAPLQLPAKRPANQPRPYRSFWDSFGRGLANGLSGG